MQNKQDMTIEILIDIIQLAKTERIIIKKLKTLNNTWINTTIISNTKVKNKFYKNTKK